MLTTTSVVNVELAGMGLFFTLGKITPRFLVVDLWELEADGVMGVVAGGVLFVGEAIDEVGDEVGIEGVVVGVTVFDGVGVSVAKSSFNPIYLKIKVTKALYK